MMRMLVANFRKARSGRTIECALSVSMDEGNTLVLFGPSGAGKTTMLRCLAGLEIPETGSVRFGDEAWLEGGRSMPPQRRNLGYVAQGPTLFPHLTARGNIEYGLHRLRPSERSARADETIATMQLRGLEDRYPQQLSGGEQQRVALARALSPRPRLLLLDEPLSSLDAVTRDQVRHELRGVLRRMGIPAILVTHDRTEALVLGQEIAVVIDGAIRQSGAIEHVFQNPVNAAVARVLGVETVVAAAVVDSSHSPWTVRAGSAMLRASPATRAADHVFVCIRSTDVLIAIGEVGQSSARNQLPARVVDLRWEGSTVRVSLDVGFALVALVTADAATELGLRPGSAVTALIKATQVQLVARGTAGE
jgi:molybdate transport system ATP-binding protein